MGKILLFYKYIAIQYPKRILKWQRQICTDLNLQGRILIGTEGINGTVGGEDVAIDRYIAIMREHELFADVDFKESPGDASYFPRMEIKVKNEICALGINPDELTVQEGGVHLEPAEFHALLENQPEDVIVLDARNNFESRIGSFRTAIKPDITNFRELPTYIDENPELFKDKRVLMNCTGGVRCERATAYLKNKGIAKEVYQLKGGIVRYIEQYPEGHFRGKNYVFDRRVAVRVNDDILSTCDQCDKPCDDYTNCVNASCNNHYISCSSCMERMGNTCSQACKTALEQGLAKRRIPFERAPEQRIVPKK